VGSLTLGSMEPRFLAANLRFCVRKLNLLRRQRQLLEEEIDSYEAYHSEIALEIARRPELELVHSTPKLRP